MKLTRTALFGLALGAATLAQTAAARPAHAQAWPVTAKWSDKARPNDPTSGSFAYEYGAEAVVIAGQMVAAGEKYDCSKFAMTVVTRYAMKHGLEIQFTLQEPVGDWKWHTVSSTDPRFTSPDDFKKMYMSWINAKAVATQNTYKIDYDTWRAGDVCMLSWKQLGQNDPFMDDKGNPKDVWHTYFVGEPGKLLFYGNDSNDLPLPVLATAEQFRLDEAMSKGDTGPAVYQQAPRRWNFLKDMVIPPAKPIALDSPLTPWQGTVTANNLNVREAPSTTGAILTVAKKDDKLTIEGKTPDGWLRVRRDDGSVAYVSAKYVKLDPAKPPYDVTGGGLVDHRFDPPATPDTPPATPPAATPAAAPAPVQPSNTNGLNGALGRGAP